MKFLLAVEIGLLRLIDGFCAIRSQALPGKERLQNCKIISHRGEHDNQTVFENTLAAFDKAEAANLWGIECDLRWTGDLQPVILHDTDLRRVFGLNLTVGHVTLAELKSLCDLVPSLQEVIQRYGKRMHMMLEIKDEVYPAPAYQNQVLAEAFSSLKPRKDFHLISMNPQMFNCLNFVDPSTFIPVARFNTVKLSKLARLENYGGLIGHYLLLTNAIVKKHHALQQQVGTGYVGSTKCLFRELNRGVEWIFSNNAAELQGMVRHLLVSDPICNLQNSNPKQI